MRALIGPALAAFGWPALVLVVTPTVPRAVEGSDSFLFIPEAFLGGVADVCFSVQIAFLPVSCEKKHAKPV